MHVNNKPKVLKSARRRQSGRDSSSHHRRNDSVENNSKDRGGQNSAVREIPGFYYDPEKKRYFKITKDHPGKKFASCQGGDRKAVSGNHVTGNSHQRLVSRNIIIPRQMSMVKHLQHREYNDAPSQITRRNMFEKLSGFLKVKQKLSLDPVYYNSFLVEGYSVTRIEPDTNYESLLMLYQTQLISKQIIQVHSLSSNEKGDLEISRRYSMTMDQKVTGLLWSPHKSTKNIFIVSLLGHGNVSGDTIVYKLDGVSQCKIGRCTVPDSTVWSNSWSRNPQFSNLISVGTSKGIVLWDINTSDVTTVECVSDVFAQEFSWSKPILYNGSRDGFIRTCDIRLTASRWPVMCLRQGKLASVTCIRALRDENYLLSSGLDGSLKLWDLRGRACVQDYQGHVNEITHKLPFYVDPTESLIFAAGQDSVTRIWSSTSGKLLRTIPFPSSDDESLKFIPALYYSEAWGGRRGMPGLLHGAGDSLYFHSF